jgi:hypothetical protein
MKYIRLFSDCCYNIQIRDEETGVTFISHVRYKKCVQSSVENTEIKRPLHVPRCRWRLSKHVWQISHPASDYCTADTFLVAYTIYEVIKGAYK